MLAHGCPFTVAVLSSENINDVFPDCVMSPNITGCGRISVGRHSLYGDWCKRDEYTGSRESGRGVESVMSTLTGVEYKPEEVGEIWLLLGAL